MTAVGRVAVAGIVAVPVLTVATLAATGSTPPPGSLLDPGPLTRWGLPAVTALRDVAAALTVGLLALAILTMQTRETIDTDDLGPDRTAVARTASVTATAWATLGAALVVLAFSEVTGRPVGVPDFWAGFGTFVAGVEIGRLLAGGALMAAVVAVGTRLVRRLSTAMILALVAAGALLPVALGGHSTGEEDHAAAVNTMVAHLVAATTWAGGLAGLVLLRVRGHDITAVAHRFSRIAGACFVAVAVSGTWRVLVRVDAPGDLLGAYGTVVGVKVVLLLALGAAGVVHRRRTLQALTPDPDRWRPFLRLVGGELALIGAAIAFGAALSRLPLP